MSLLKQRKTDLQTQYAMKRLEGQWACSEVTVDDGYERFIEQYVQDLEKYKNMDESDFHLDKLLSQPPRAY